MAEDEMQAAMRQRCQESGHVWLYYGFLADAIRVCKCCGHRELVRKKYACSEETLRIQEARDGGQ